LLLNNAKKKATNLDGAAEVFMIDALHQGIPHGVIDTANIPYGFATTE